MLITTLIHALEIITAALVMLLAVQLVRCYRADYVLVQDASKQHSSKGRLREGLQQEVEQKIQLEPEVPQLSNAARVSISQLQSASVERSAPASASEAILNDYIGGFFDAPQAADIAQFKAPESPLAVKAREEALAVPELEELEEDIIMVSSEREEGSANDKVMSDKVVHAMLDEAKLVCAS